MFLFETEQGNNTVIYVAVIGGVFTLVGGFLGFLYARNKNNVEIEGNKKKNAAQDLQNKQTGNTVLDETTGFIEELGSKVIELQKAKYLVEQDLERERMLKAEALGKAQGAIEDRDKFLDRVRRLETEVSELKDFKSRYETLSGEFEALKLKVEAMG